MATDYRLLMARYQAGDGAAFEELYGLLAPEMPQMVRGLDPEGCVDQAVEAIFLHIHRARSSYDPRRPFEPWLTAIVRHVTGAQRERRRPQHPFRGFLARMVASRPASARHGV